MLVGGVLEKSFQVNVWPQWLLFNMFKQKRKTESFRPGVCNSAFYVVVTSRKVKYLARNSIRQHHTIVWHTELYLCTHYDIRVLWDKQLLWKWASSCSIHLSRLNCQLSHFGCFNSYDILSLLLEAVVSLQVQIPSLWGELGSEAHRAEPVGASAPGCWRSATLRRSLGL